MAPDREELLARADSVQILPMMSNMMVGVFRVMADPDASFSQLYDVVKYDQAVSSKIMSIANSPYYNRGTPVTSLERAMVMVGFKEIERIIMCLVFMKQIISRWKLTQDDMATMWGHSLTVAHAAQSPCAKMGVQEPKKAFAISIVHDVGKVIVYTYDDRYRSVAKEAALRRRDICDLERSEYGIDHQEVGHRMSVRWNFPGEFSEAILTHPARPTAGYWSLISCGRLTRSRAEGRVPSRRGKEQRLTKKERL